MLRKYESEIMAMAIIACFLTLILLYHVLRNTTRTKRFFGPNIFTLTILDRQLTGVEMAMKNLIWSKKFDRHPPFFEATTFRLIDKKLLIIPNSTFLSVSVFFFLALMSIYNFGLCELLKLKTYWFLSVYFFMFFSKCSWVK